MDKKDILPGEVWEPAIQKAIRSSDFFLVCLSPNSVNRRGQIQKEIKRALNIWEEMLVDDIYLIPVRLEECDVPDSLRRFQWVNLFEADSWARLVQAIREGMARRTQVVELVESYSDPEEPSGAPEQKHSPLNTNPPSIAVQDFVPYGKKLRTAMCKAFSIPDLKLISADIGLGTDFIGNGTREYECQRLIDECIRRGSPTVSRLLTECRGRRPGIHFPDPPEDGSLW